MDRLSERDLEAMRCIAYHLRSKRYAITIRELGDAMGISSPSSTHARISKLRRMGLLDHRPEERRTVHLTDDGISLLQSNRCSIYTQGVEEGYGPARVDAGAVANTLREQELT